jgi:hypothetical protein
MIRTLLKLALVALVAKFQDGIQYAAQNRGSLSDDALQARILEIAAQFQVPVTASDVAVSRRGNHTLIDVSYVRPVDLAPGLRYPWPFSFHLDILTLGAL